ncbi:MAG: hypothetical protein OXC46_12035, partial [Thaumarchaeota archaeon]|nr:hypothetical protein [Nitrososphaerota archaeon]
FAQELVIIPRGEVEDSNSLVLDGARQVSILNVNEKYYAVVTALVDNGVQIIDVTDPENPVTKDSIIDDIASELAGAYAVSTYTIEDKHYAIISGNQDNGIQILDITNPDTIIAKGIFNSGTQGISLQGLFDVATYSIGDKYYTAVISSSLNQFRIFDVTDPDTIMPKKHSNRPAIFDAYGIDTYSIGNSHYAVVVGNDRNGIHIREVTNPDEITYKHHIYFNGPNGDGVGGVASLESATDVDVYSVGGRYYAVVTSELGKVQIMDVTNPNRMIPKGMIENDNTIKLGGARAVSTFSIGDYHYAAIAAETDNAVQILNITNPNRITPVDNISDNDTLELAGLRHIETYTIGSKSYAIAPAQTDDGIQILELNLIPTADAGKNKTVTIGRTVTLDGSASTDNGDLTYSWNQDSGEDVEISDDMIAMPTFDAPRKTDTLVFTLTVNDGDNSDTDTVTIKVIPKRDIKDMDETIVAVQITGPNEITIAFNKELSTFINSYLNFTISGEDTARNITGIDGSPSKRGIISIDGEDVNAYLTILTFDGEPAPAGSTGSMYIQHADHYLKLATVTDAQN